MIEIGSVSVNYYCLIVYVANSLINQNNPFITTIYSSAILWNVLCVSKNSL